MPQLLHAGCVSSVFVSANALLGDGMKVVKAYHKGRQLQARHWLNITREMAILRQLKELRVPGVVRLCGTADDSHNLYLVFEACLGGDLYKRLAHRGLLSEAELCTEVITPLLKVLVQLHEHGIVHRDIKPENIFFDAAGRLVLGDFGLAINSACERPTSRVGTLDYMAPEVLAQPSPDIVALRKIRSSQLPSYGAAVDVWAVGVLCYEALLGVTPFSDPDPQTAALKAQFRPPAPLGGAASPALSDFVAQALTKQAGKRPSALQLLVHPWVQAHMPPAEAAAWQSNMAASVGAEWATYGSLSAASSVAMERLASSSSSGAPGAPDASTCASEGSSCSELSCGAVAFASVPAPQPGAQRGPKLPGQALGQLQPLQPVPRLSQPPLLPPPPHNCGQLPQPPPLQPPLPCSLAKAAAAAAVGRMRSGPLPIPACRSPGDDEADGQSALSRSASGAPMGFEQAQDVLPLPLSPCITAMPSLPASPSSSLGWLSVPVSPVRALLAAASRRKLARAGSFGADSKDASTLGCFGARPQAACQLLPTTASRHGPNTLQATHSLPSSATTLAGWQPAKAGCSSPGATATPALAPPGAAARAAGKCAECVSLLRACSAGPEMILRAGLLGSSHSASGHSAAAFTAAASAGAPAGTPAAGGTSGTGSTAPKQVLCRYPSAPEPVPGLLTSPTRVCSTAPCLAEETQPGGRPPAPGAGVQPRTHKLWLKIQCLARLGIVKRRPAAAAAGDEAPQPAAAPGVAAQAQQ